MRRLMNMLRGMAVVRLTGLFPERLINLCAQEGIEFWAMEWEDEHTVRFTTRRRTLGLLEELAGRLLTAGSADPAAARDELLHTMACKAAIKGGWRSGAEELEEVARLVMSGAVKYCPHGRPVAIELTRKQLEKQFKRA